jgi:hypothetical protein
VVALGVLWIVLSLVLPLSRALTAALAAFALVAAVAAVQVWSGEGDEKRVAPDLATRWRALTFRKKANLLAAFVAFLTFVGVAIALLSQPIPDTNAGKNLGDTTRTTTKTHEVGTGKEGRTVKLGKTQVVEEQEPVTKPDESLLGRAVDNPAGVILVRLGLALLASFIAGLVVQRILLGKYAVTLPFGLGGVQEITDDKTAPVTQNANKDPALRKEIHIAKDESDGPRRIYDPKRVMVGLGPDMASALRYKASVLDISPDVPADMLIDHLEDKTALGSSGAQALRTAIDLSDQAYEGAKLAPGAEEWVTDVGQYLPEAIKNLEVTNQ